MLGKSGHGSVTRLVIPYHVQRLLEGLIMSNRREWRGKVKSDENANVQELIFSNSEFWQKTTLGGERESRSGRYEIQRGNEFVDAWVKQGIGGPVNGVDVGFWVALQVN
jgi:hypothetical protein